jgi:hypothetical protein
MATSPIYSWPEPDNTDLVKNGALAIRTLGNAIDTTMGTMVAKTVVDAKGDLIAGTAADTVNRLAVGNNGETLVADSSTSTGLRYNPTTAAGKNAVINGAMNNWQRGTSVSVSGTVGFTADRWLLTTPTSNTASRSTDAPAGFPYSLKWDIAGSYPLLSTYIELPATGVKGQYTGTWTISFWAKGSASFSNSLEVAFNNGSNRVDRVQIGSTQTIALTTTWTKYTYSYDLTSPTINANNKAIEILFYSESGTKSMYVTGMQFEQGSVATAFTMAGGTIQGELAACQRYYVRFNAGNAYGNVANSGYTASSTQVNAFFQFPVNLRTIPTAIDSSAVSYLDVTGTGTTVSSPSSAASGVNYANVSWTTSSATAGRFCWFRDSAGAGTGYVGFSAEL